MERRLFLPAEVALPFMLPLTLPLRPLAESGESRVPLASSMVVVAVVALVGEADLTGNWASRGCDPA